MPIYEYKCTACQAVREVMQKFSDTPLTECAQCGGRLERLISPPGLHFKGSGWYVTDYARAGRSNGKSEAGKSEKEKSDSPATAKPAKTESKAPAGKAD